MATEYTEKALEALRHAHVEFGDHTGQVIKDVGSAVVYALLDIAQAVRSSK